MTKNFTPTNGELIAGMLYYGLLVTLLLDGFNIPGAVMLAAYVLPVWVYASRLIAQLVTPKAPKTATGQLAEATP